MEFHNVELVWNSEFHKNEKAQKCTGIHDHSSSMCLNWVGWGGCSYHCDTYTASAVERIDHLRLINSLKLFTYL